MVEDQVLIRKGIKRLLEADGRVRVMAEAGSAEEALEKASEGCPPTTDSRPGWEAGPDSLCLSSPNPRSLPVLL